MPARPSLLAALSSRGTLSIRGADAGTSAGGPVAGYTTAPSSAPPKNATMPSLLPSLYTEEEGASLLTFGGRTWPFDGALYC